MSAPAGWHPDPSPGEPGVAPLLRYWDGQRWTEHTTPYPSQGPAAGSSPYAGPDGAQQPAYPYAAGGIEATTPDGAPLASWWQRVGATLIDNVILFLTSLVLYIPFYGRLYDAFSDYFNQVEDAANAGRQAPSATALQADLLPTLALVTGIALVFNLIWTIAWLRTKGATPGKLALGLRIRRREAPGQLPYGVILRRWFGQYGVSLLSLVPVVGIIGGLYSLLDVLWAAWDSKRQTLHDKVAGTNVIRVR